MHHILIINFLAFYSLINSWIDAYVESERMKLKYFFLIIIVLSTFFFESCKNCVDTMSSILFWPEEVDKNITQKTRMKPFSNLEDPIVVAMPLYEDYNFLGIGNWNTKSVQIGNVLVVFDSKTESVYDWAFTKGARGWNDYQMLSVNDNWWISGENGEAAKLNPKTGEISVYKHDIESHIQCQIAYGKNFVLAPSRSYDPEKRKSIFRYYLFNTDSFEIEKISWEVESDDDSIGGLSGDFNGNFWLCRNFDGNQTLCNLFQDKIVKKEIVYDEKQHTFEVKLINDNYVFIIAYKYYNDEDSSYPRMYIYDKSSSEIQMVDISDVSLSNYNIYEGVEVNGNVFFICLSEEFGESLKIAEFDSENRKLKLLDPVLEHNFTGWPYKCGSRIYMLDWWNMQELKYEWYDTEKGIFSSPKVIKLEDIIS